MADKKVAEETLSQMEARLAEREQVLAIELSKTQEALSLLRELKSIKLHSVK